MVSEFAGIAKFQACYENNIFSAFSMLSSFYNMKEWREKEQESARG